MKGPFPYLAFKRMESTVHCQAAELQVVGLHGHASRGRGLIIQRTSSSSRLLVGIEPTLILSVISVLFHAARISAGILQ